MKRTILGAVLFVAGALSYQVAVSHACGLDGIPSLLVDSHRVSANHTTPTTAAQLAAWAPFVVSRTFNTGQAISLSEDKKEVARSLTAAAMRRPWRWHFGDGTTSYGWTVKHAYARPGHWQVSVDAYAPSTGKWYSFDRVTLTITKHR